MVLSLRPRPFALLCALLLLAPGAQATIRYVKPTGNDGSGGLTWALAMRTVQAAINSSAGGDQIWVAKGAYNERLTLKNAAAIYGGFAGTEGSLEQRDPAVNVTIIDGKLVGTVVTAPLGITRAAVVDGFTIRNGVGSFPDGFGNLCGGGFACDGSPTISNNVITANTAHAGGGIWTGLGSPAILNNVITGNSAFGSVADGAGISCFQSTLVSGNTITNNATEQSGAGISAGGTVVIENNTISNNTAQSGAGGILFYGTSGQITGNTITGNSAIGFHGAGILCYGTSSPTIADCVIANNNSRYAGGGIYTQAGSPTILRCRIENNLARSFNPFEGGGGIASSDGSPVIEACEITGNQAPNASGGGILLRGNGNPRVLRCLVKGNLSGGDGGGLHVMVGTGPSPGQVVNCLFAQNLAGGDGGAIFGGGFLNVLNCTLADNAAGGPALAGGLAAAGSVDSLTAANNIIAFNSSGIRSITGAKQVLQRNCVYGNGAYNYSQLAPGTTDISADPLFREQPAQDYQLTHLSPCIDSGLNSWVQPGSKDQEGNARIAGSTVDRGALEYTPGVPLAVTLNPNRVVGGTQATGTVALDRYAPKGGTFVAIASGNPAAATPASVTVPEGAISATFNVSTVGVTSDAVGNIAAATNMGQATAQLTVTPPEVLSLVLSPQIIFGGTNVTATVTIKGKAPAGGIDVTLSSDRAAATVPAKVKVPAGNSVVTFTITTTPVAADTTAVIRASLGSNFRSNSLYIYAPGPKSITFNPAQVRGGQASVGTVTLSGKAPAGGQLVTLQALHPSIATPDVNSVTVAAGQTTATFGVTTFPVPSLATGVIKATASGKSVQIGIRVYPAVPRTITFSANPIHGGKQVTATLTLVSPAPAGGLVVALSSKNTAVATVPPNVTVAAGQMSATFPVQTYGVASGQKPVIVAGANGLNIFFALQVLPAVPLTIKFNPSPVKGGNDVSATLTINGSAHAAGLTVAIVSQNPEFATGPTSVVVPAGQSQVEFTVKTKTVTAQQLAVFKATASGTSIFIGLRVWP